MGAWGLCSSHASHSVSRQLSLTLMCRSIQVAELSLFISDINLVLQPTSYLIAVQSTYVVRAAGFLGF